MTDSASRETLDSARPGAVEGASQRVLPQFSDLVRNAPAPVDGILSKLDDVQQEISGLRTELGLLRRRDGSLGQFMQRLDEEMHLAARLQLDFLPKMLPQWGSLRFHALYRPAGYVSGDLYDVMRLDEHHVGFYVADAVGHGVPAALLSLFLKHALVNKELTASPPGYRLLDPADALARLNSSLIAQNLSQTNFATAVYGMVNVNTLEMRFAKAGHPAPLRFQRSGESEFLHADGSLLGIFPDAVFETRILQLAAGDRLVIYTDGLEVTYAADRLSTTEDGPAIPRWRDELARQQHGDPARWVQEIGVQIDQQCGASHPADDVTLLVIEIA